MFNGLRGVQSGFDGLLLTCAFRKSTGSLLLEWWKLAALHWTFTYPDKEKELIADAMLRACSLFIGAPPIDIVISDYIVLIEISPRLDLDEKGRDLTRICQAMLLADRDIGGLVLA